MSRIVVKNLPKRITSEKLRNVFSAKGEITDLQLKFTNEGIFRQFAFIGFKNIDDAREAVNYFNSTFIDTNRITVEFCKDFSSKSQDNDESKKSKRDKNKNAKQSKGNLKKNVADEISEEKKIGKKVKETEDEKEKKEKKKKKIDPFEEMKDDKEFAEFIKVHRNIETQKGKQIWSDDVVQLNHDEDKDDDETQEEEEVNKSDDLEVDDETTKKNTAAKPSYEFTIKMKGLPYKAKRSQVREFLKPLKPISLRLPPKLKGIAYASFKTEKELKQALIKNRGFIDGHRIDVLQEKKKVEITTTANVDDKKKKWKNRNEVPADETVAESGRIFIRNLSYLCTSDDLEKLFSPYGQLSELHLPIDSYTKKVKGFAFVTFMFPEHAVKAFTELDGTVFQGRMLHLIPAKAKPDKVDMAPPFADEGSSFKKKKQEDKKAKAANTYNWNSLFLGANALADVITDKYQIKKSELLGNSDAKDSLAVRMALGETQIVDETRRFLLRNGVALDSFSQPDAPRSKNVLIVKNLPAKTTPNELNDMFSKLGLVSRVILPPSGVTAIVEMQEPNEAQVAFRKLAYSNFKHYPLYLEWAPIDVFKASDQANEDVEGEAEDKVNETDHEKEEHVKSNAIPNQSTEKDTSSDESEDDEPEEDTTIFVKNINFDTDDDTLKRHFEQCGVVHSAVIARRKNPSDGRGLLSFGYGFVQYKLKKSAQKALKDLQHSILDEHTLDLKLSHRSTLPQQQQQSIRKKTKSTKQTGTKIVVRNIPFEAKQREIEQLFSAFGELKSVRIPKKLSGTGTHRGFGFVDFVTRNDAKRALKALCHSTHLYGRRLVLEWAEVEELSDDADTNDNVAMKIGHQTAKNFHEGPPRKRLKKSDIINNLVAQTTATTTD